MALEIYFRRGEVAAGLDRLAALTAPTTAIRKHIGSAAPLLELVPNTATHLIALEAGIGHQQKNLVALQHKAAERRAGIEALFGNSPTLSAHAVLEMIAMNQFPVAEPFDGLLIDTSDRDMGWDDLPIPFGGSFVFAEGGTGEVRWGPFRDPLFPLWVEQMVPTGNEPLRKIHVQRNLATTIRAMRQIANEVGVKAHLNESSSMMTLNYVRGSDSGRLAFIAGARQVWHVVAEVYGFHPVEGHQQAALISQVVSFDEARDARYLDAATVQMGVTPDFPMSLRRDLLSATGDITAARLYQQGAHYYYAPGRVLEVTGGSGTAPSWGVVSHTSFNMTMIQCAERFVNGALDAFARHTAHTPRRTGAGGVILEAPLREVNHPFRNHPAVQGQPIQLRMEVHCGGEHKAGMARDWELNMEITGPGTAFVPFHMTSLPVDANNQRAMQAYVLAQQQRTTQMRDLSIGRSGRSGTVE